MVRKKDGVGTYILLLFTASFWGSAFVFSKIAENSVPSLVAAFVRFGLSAVLAVAMLLIQKVRDPDFSITPKGAWLDTVLLGLVGITVYNLFFFWGLALSRASDGSMIVPTLTPAITVVFAVLFLKERFRRNQTLGLFITLIGSMVFFSTVVFAGVPNVHRRLMGDLLFLGAAVFWATSTLLSKRAVNRMDPFLATTYAMVFGSVVLGAITVPQLFKVDWTRLGWRFWLDQVYLAVFPSVLANWFYFTGVNRIGASRASVFLYFVPMSALIIAALVLRDMLTLWQFVGAAVMMAGVWLINRKSRSPEVAVQEAASQ